MFQRLVYSKETTGAVITHAQLGRIEEPVLSSPYRTFLPNFVRTDDHGEWLDKQTAASNPFYLHHLSGGLVRLEGKHYAPIQATYLGGELFINDFGLLDIRLRGELRFDKENRPLYLLGRKVKPDHKFFALHQDFLLSKNAVGRNVYLVHLRSDSPFLMEYLDGRECNFDVKPIPVAGVFPEEWELTTDFTKAQQNYDLCIVPEAADGECFVKGEVLCFRRKVSFAKVPVYLPDGTLQGVIRDDEGNFVGEAWQWAMYTYYEAIPYPEYREPLRGQGKTEGYYFRSLSQRIEPAEIQDIEKPEVVEYARLKLVSGTGVPALHNEERVCRLCTYSPSRGVFYKIDEDGVRYPIMVTPDTSEGYGIPTATLHHAYDEITHECTDVVHHPSHLIQRQGAELMLTADNECWRACGKIEGTIPPDLGDPRILPKRIVFVERRSDVTGQMPNITSLMSGTYLNLAIGQILYYADYRSAIPSYPSTPDPEIMWNPGGLNRAGFDFLGFVTYPNAIEPLFMLSGDLSIGTLFPVWQRRVPTEFVSLTFCGCNFPGDNSWQVGNYSITIQVPKGVSLDTKHYNPIDIPHVNPENGLFFGGWSHTITGSTEITCNTDMILRPVTSEIPMELDDEEGHWVTFSDGDVNPVPLRVSDGTVLDLTKYIAYGEGKIFLGWSTELMGAILDKYEIYQGTTFYAQFQLDLRYSRFHTVTFTVAGNSGRQFFGQVPDPITVKYGSELDLVGYGDEMMLAYGLYFAGWSTDPNFQIPVPRIVVVTDIMLYAVWYTARLPYSQPSQHTIAFGNGSRLILNRSSVLRLIGFNPDGLGHMGYEFVGWNVFPSATESLFHLVVRENVFLFPVWRKRLKEAPPHCGCGHYIVDIPSIYAPTDVFACDPYDVECELSPYNPDNPYAVGS
jgi:hypothetical protein